MAKNEGVSLNPESFTEGGGLIDDVDAIFKSCSFEMFDYNGKVIPPVPSLRADLEVDGEEVTQYWSMGSAQDWMPSDDGMQLIAVGKVTGIRASSNGGIFLKSLIDAGFPVDKIGSDISAINGMQAHLIRVPAPKRAGLKKTPRADGREYDDTILTVSEILALPGEKKNPAGKPKATPKGKPAAAAKAAATEEDGGGEVEGKALEAVMAILAEAGSIAKKDLPAKIFQTMKADPDRNAVVKLVFDDKFLSNGPWEYADGTLVLG